MKTRASEARTPAPLAIFAGRSAHLAPEDDAEMAGAAKVKIIGDLADLTVGKRQHVASRLQLLAGDILGDGHALMLFEQLLQVFSGNAHGLCQIVDGCLCETASDDGALAFLDVAVERLSLPSAAANEPGKAEAAFLLHLVHLPDCAGKDRCTKMLHGN